MANNISPGFYLDTDIETLLVAELQFRGVNMEDKDFLRKNLVMHLQEGTADFYWTWEGVPILRFAREIVTEKIIAYSVIVERKIVTPGGGHGQPPPPIGSA